MSDNPPTNPPADPAIPPANTPPADPPTPPANTPPANSSDQFDVSALLNAFNALPEKVANAVREASAPRTSTPPANTPPADPPTEPKNATPGKRSFAERWFG